MTDEDLPFFYKLTISYQHDPKYPGVATFIFPAKTDMMDEVWTPGKLGLLAKADQIYPSKIVLEEVYITSDWDFEAHEINFAPAWDVLIEQYLKILHEAGQKHLQAVRDLSKQHDAGERQYIDYVQKQAEGMARTLQYGSNEYESVREAKLAWIAESLKENPGLAEKLCQNPPTQ